AWAWGRVRCPQWVRMRGERVRAALPAKTSFVPAVSSCILLTRHALRFVPGARFAPRRPLAGRGCPIPNTAGAPLNVRGTLALDCPHVRCPTVVGRAVRAGAHAQRAASTRARAAHHGARR